MQIQDFSIEDYAAFVEQFLVSFNRDNMAYYDTRIKKVLKCKDFATVSVKQPRQYACGPAALEKYRFVFQNANDEKLYAVLERDMGKTSLLGKKRVEVINISDSANQFFETCSKNSDESAM